MSTVIDITGKQFGRWTVIQRAGTRTHTRSRPALWLVRCVCGTEAVLAGGDLRIGNTSSCGCLRDEKIAVVGKRYIGAKHHNWKGGRSTAGKGYISIAISLVRELYPNAVTGRKPFEHVAVMSHHLGRALYPNETVHHKNGIKTENNIDNLELRVGQHGPGQTVDDTIEWATEILRRYAPDRLVK